MEYLLEDYTSPEGSHRGADPETGKEKSPTPAICWSRTASTSSSGMFHGFDFDATMLRIAAMNLMLHGVDDPDIHYQDTLSSLPRKVPEAAATAST